MKTLDMKKKPGIHLWAICANRRGFTIIEVLIALTIFAIGILAVVTMQTTSVNGNAKARQISEGTSSAVDQIEKLIRFAYADPNLNDSDGDGTNQDADQDGVDETSDTNINGICDVGENCFGLDDASALTADGNATSVDGTYRLYWNVAVGQPAPNLKTIRVIVQHNTANTPPVTVEFIKNNAI